ncbi:MAG: carboxylate-amine ligase [Hyphomicrobiales bacterium]|nr:MAG: carboxylate-amine ligase [Hyphomicrobiales bacterium]
MMMSSKEPNFTLGIEEEYLLVDLASRDLVVDPPHEFMRTCKELLGDHVTPEFLRCQVEIGTPVCADIDGARTQLQRMRRTIANAARHHGMAPIACSTHPFAHWDRQQNTDKDRYNELAKDLQVVVRRMVICGMHVHIGIDDENVRNDIFSQLTYFLPHLLALSTSSPFWQGRLAGLKSYRLSVFDEMPRTGLPYQFESAGEYKRTVQTLISAGVIEDSTKIWWDLRPSHRFPTLEMRITDVCTRLEDALAIAALYRCLARMVYRLRVSNQRWRTYSRFLLNENRWLAQRHGVKGGLIDFGRGETIPYAQLIEELLELIAEDAEALNCVAEVNHCRTIVSQGTSADRQIETYQRKLADGASEKDALIAVVDQLIAETVEGL